jgi:Flp pilus assembly protein TadD
MWRRTVVMAIFTAVVMGARLSMMKNRPKFNPLDNEGLYLEPPHRQLHWAYLIFVNTWLLISPSQLIHDYRMGAIPLLRTFTDPRHLLTALTFTIYLLLGLFSLGLFQRTIAPSPDSRSKTTRINGRLRVDDTTATCAYTRSERMLLFGLSLLIFPFVPASNLFMTVGFVVAERILYLPSLGICFIIGYGVSVLLASQKRTVKILAVLGFVLVLVSQSVKVVKRNPEWDSKLTLYEAGVRMYPHNGNLLGNIGLNYRKRGDSELAEKVYRYSMEVAPDSSLSFMNFGIMLKDDGRLREAEEVLKQAADVMLSDPTAEGKDERKAKLHVTVGNLIAADANRLEEALHYVSKGVAIKPMLPNAHNSKGSVLHKMGRILEAKEEFEEAIRCNPNYANAHFNLGLVLYQTGNTTAAVNEFQTTLKIDPNHMMAKLQLENMQQNGEIPVPRKHT